MKDTDKRLRNYRTILAGFLLVLPLFLMVLTGEVRKSISDYAYADMCFLLPIFLTIASSLFIIDNVIDRHKWYNVILGISLLGVAFTPHNDYEILHYTFASIFFFGSAFVMVFFSSKKQRWFKHIFAGIITASIITAFIFDGFSLFLGEWIALLPTSIHYVGEALKKID